MLKLSINAEGKSEDCPNIAADIELNFHDVSQLALWIFNQIHYQESVHALAEELVILQTKYHRSLVKFEGSRVEVYEIDDLLDDGYDPDSFVGKKLIYHDGRPYPLMKLPTGRLVAAIPHRCEFCHKNPVTVFHGSGLHNGAWCYGYDLSGEYVANFRDQNYVCTVCNEARKQNDPTLANQTS